MKKKKVILVYVDHRNTLEYVSDGITADSDSEECNLFVILDMSPENDKIQVTFRKYFENGPPWYVDYFTDKEMIRNDGLDFTPEELHLMTEEMLRNGWNLDHYPHPRREDELAYEAIPLQSLEITYIKNGKKNLRDYLFIVEIYNNMERRDLNNGFKADTMIKDWMNELQKKTKVPERHLRALHTLVVGRNCWD